MGLRARNHLLPPMESHAMFGGCEDLAGVLCLPLLVVLYVF